MASPAITSSIFQEIQSFNQTRRSDLQQLASALQSGDLGAAQQAFTDLSTAGKSGPYRNAEPFSNSSRAQAFEAIGQALQSGDLAGAQAAFTTLQSTFARPVSQAQPATPAVVVNIGGNDATTGTAATESIYQQLQDFREARKTDLAQLGTALQSGGTAAAQQAFTALQALSQGGPNSNGAVFQRSDRAQAFAAIGTALQNGDLAGAQQAFATLARSFDHAQQPAPTATPGPSVPEIVIHLGGAGNQTGSNPEIVINVASGSGSASAPEEIKINLAGNQGGQLTIDLSQNPNGNGEHIAIDYLQQNNDFRIALDLSNPTHNLAQTNSLNLQA